MSLCLSCNIFSPSRALLILYTRKNVLTPYPLYVACKPLVLKQLLVDIRPLNPL